MAWPCEGRRAGQGSRDAISLLSDSRCSCSAKCFNVSIVCDWSGGSPSRGGADRHALPGKHRQVTSHGGVHAHSPGLEGDGCIRGHSGRAWLHGSRHGRATALDSRLRVAAMSGTTPRPIVDLSFPHRWQAEVLTARPLILPARRFVYPREAEEVDRGALEVLIRPEGDDALPFLATCALGFRDPAAPTGLWSTPKPERTLRGCGRICVPDRHRSRRNGSR